MILDSSSANPVGLIMSVQGPKGDPGDSPPLSAYYRPLQGTRSDITSTITSGSSIAAVGKLWGSSAGLWRYAGCSPVAFGDGTVGQNLNPGSTWTQPVVIEFWSNATDLRIHLVEFSNCDVWALCDDQRITPGFKAVTSGEADGGGYSTWALTQSSPDWHKWRICVPSYFYGISHESGAVLVPTSPGFQLAVVGDSYVQGGISIDNALGPTTAGTIAAGFPFGEFEQITGLDVWRCGVGGTGYVSNFGHDATWPYGSTTRMAALAALPAMNAVLVFGTLNDAPYSPSTVVTAAQATWAAIKAAQPSAPLIVAGVESGNPDATLDALNTALLAAAAADPSVSAVINLRGPNNFVAGSGNIGTPAGDGNADVFLNSDGIHPTNLGSRYWGQNLARLLGPVSLP